MPPSISYNAAGTYNINLTIDEGLPTQSFYCKKVVVVSAPILTITPNITSCYDSVVQLNVSGASSYSWSPKTWLNDSTIANPIATPQSTVKYIVSAKNSIGCAAKDSVTITVLPKATTTKDTIKNCGSVVYNFIIYTKDSLLTSNKKNYLGCDSIIQQHQIIIAKEKYDTISKSICTNQSYLGHNITGFYPIDTIHLASGCDNINILKLTVDSYIRDTIFPVICFDSSFKKHNTTGIYFDTIHAPAFCDTLQLINLTVKKPNPTLPSDTSICSGDILTLYPGKFINYTWNNTTTTSTLKVQNVGTYWVIVKDTFGCQVTDTFKLISLYNKPANFLPNQLTICTGERFTVPNYVSYKWITGETTATIHLNGLPNYWVKVTDKNQCLGSDTMKIIYSGFDKFSLINAFTPNNDGYNDFFKPLTGSCIIAFSMFIYNRWGQLVYQTHNLQGKGWDGYINESQAPIGVYYYIISYKNINDEQKKQTGSVTLLR
jgi:gliding motility-associated-like protein